jgi:hypothetical protein
LVAELSSLIKELGNSQVVSATSSAAGTPSTLSSDTLANLNSAFDKLISDLGGTTSDTTSGTTSASATGAAAGTSSAAGTATTGIADTSALQSFLTSFLQDLQSSSSAAPSTRGNSVDVSA